jgi:hypothetical protein
MHIGVIRRVDLYCGRAVNAYLRLATGKIELEVAYLYAKLGARHVYYTPSSSRLRPPHLSHLLLTSTVDPNLVEVQRR